MPASILKSPQSRRSRRTKSEKERRSLQKKTKTKKKQKQSFSRLTKKQTGPSQDHPTPPKGESLEKSREIELRVKDRSKISVCPQKKRALKAPKIAPK